jgi:hypothetical protein
MENTTEYESFQDMKVTINQTSRSQRAFEPHCQCFEMDRTTCLCAGGNTTLKVQIMLNSSFFEIMDHSLNIKAKKAVIYNRLNDVYSSL